MDFVDFLYECVVICAKGCIGAITLSVIAGFIGCVFAGLGYLWENF